MRRVLFIICIAVFFSSCEGNRPNDVMDAKKMEDVLSDIYLAEAYSTFVNDSLHTMRNRNLDSLAVYYKTILTHHNISRETLAKSVNWYKRNPEELDTVYAKVITDLSKLQGQFPPR